MLKMFAHNVLSCAKNAQPNAIKAQWNKAKNVLLLAAKLQSRAKKCKRVNSRVIGLKMGMKSSSSFFFVKQAAQINPVSPKWQRIYSARHSLIGYAVESIGEHEG